MPEDFILAQIEEEILFFFSLKKKRLERKAGKCPDASGEQMPKVVLLKSILSNVNKEDLTDFAK